MSGLIDKRYRDRAPSWRRAARWRGMVGALALLLLLCPARGWAYIDPNAGGFLAQMIAPLIAVGASFLFYCRKQLARYFKSGTRKVEQQELRAEPDSQSRD